MKQYRVNRQQATNVLLQSRDYRPIGLELQSFVGTKVNLDGSRSDSGWDGHLRGLSREAHTYALYYYDRLGRVPPPTKLRRKRNKKHPASKN